MQSGSVSLESRKRRPAVWCFRWREPAADGRRIHRRIVLGTAEELKSIASAGKMVVGLRHEINNNDIRLRKPITLADLSRHYQQRELADRNSRIGLRRSELFALQWKDIDFEAKQIHISRSIVQSVVGICKTESSQKPVPIHDACPKEHQQHLELAAFYPKIAGAYTQIATIATDDHYTLQEFRASVGAEWTFLSDPERKVQKELDIHEYTDPEHNPMIPHTLVLKPGLVIHSIYNGYWFWGRPSLTDLWHDLRAVTSEIRPDWDLSTPGLRESWNAGDLSRFHGWNKRDTVEASLSIAQKK
jgi:integrase